MPEPRDRSLRTFEVWTGVNPGDGQNLVSTHITLTEAWRAARPGLDAVYDRLNEGWADPEDSTW